MSNIHYFTGKAKWAKVYKPDDKFGEAKFSIDVLLDMDQYTKFKALKVKNNGKPEDGKMWVTFRRKATDGPPVVVDSSGSKLEESIGNDSEVTCKLEVETFTSKKYGSVTRSSLVGVQVDKLVVYNPDEKSQETRPGDHNVSVGASPGMTVKPRIMF